MKLIQGQTSSRIFAVLQREEGSSLVEFSLTVTILLSVIFGVIGMSQLAYAKHFVAFAARQATRYAIVRGSTFAGTTCATPTTAYSCQTNQHDVSNYVKSQVPLGLTSQSTTVTTTWSGLTGSGLPCLTLAGLNSPGCVVQVTVAYRFAFGLPFLPPSATTIQSTSAATVVQ